MAAIFTSRTTAYDGSGSPINGAGTVRIDYTCVPPKGGQLYVFAKNTGASTPYKCIRVIKEPTVLLFEADSVSYYVEWIPLISSSATLDIG